MRSRERVLKIILLLLAQPYRYTRRDLAKRYCVSKNTIDADIKEIELAGLHLDQGRPHYGCAILPDKDFKELQYLMPLTPEDRFKITTAIDRASGSSKEANYLKKKISSLYDFQRLGIRALRRPELEKLDLLNAGKNQEQRVMLENYRSNSNEVKNRIVEPFHIDSEQGMLQAFDIDDQASKHFKISRINRVQLTEIPWMFRERHYYKYTDVFRIADNNKISIHLELDVFAYNALIENYPKALADIINGSVKNTFDFQTEVNHRFLGVTNFILANRGHVQILSPNNLREHIRQEAQKIIDQLQAFE